MVIACVKLAFRFNIKAPVGSRISLNLVDWRNFVLDKGDLNYEDFNGDSQ